MNRKDTTKFLGDLLVSDRFGGMGKYYAREVSIDYGTRDVKRVDFMQFEPAGVTSISSIEKGIFTCYEVKSCKEDVFSGNGLNFLGEKNYIVTTMECYKSIQEDIRSGKLDDYTCLPFGETPDKPEIEWNKDAMYPGHGDKSLIMLMGYIDLTEEEKACIRYHMGSFTDKKEWEYYSRAVRIFPNILYTHMADMIASQIKGV